MAVQESVSMEFGNNLGINEIIKHELKTPMSSDIIMLNLLLNGKFGSLNDIQKEILVNIISSNLRSLLILNNYSSYEGLKNLSFCECSIKKLIESAVCDLDLIFKDKKQEIFIDCIKDFFLYADKKELNRVFYNLLINLSELSDEGSKNVVYIRKIEDFLEVLFINKTHEGIFYQNRKGKFRKVSRDMSFDICKKIINLHKGKLEVSSFGNSLYAL